MRLASAAPYSSRLRPLILSIEARVEHGPAGFHAVVHTTRPDGRDFGSRELTGKEPDCSDLFEQLTLVIALTIDPDAELRAKDSPPPVPPKAARQKECPEPRVEVVERERRVLVPVTTKREPWSGDSRLALTATLGLLPGVTPGLLAAGSVKPPGLLPIELSGSAWPERSAEVAGGGAHFTLLAGELALCPTTPIGGVARAHFCGGLALGSMRARGFGFDENAEQAEPIFMISGRFRLSLRIGSYAHVDLGAGLLGSVVRPRFFYVDPSGVEKDVHRVPPVGANAEIGFGFSFGSEFRTAASMATPEWDALLATELAITPPCPSAARERQSFRSLYEEHAAFVWRTLRRLGVAPAHVEDACQETFVIVHKKLDDFDGVSPKSWLFAIALRVASDFRKRAHVRREKSVADVPESMVPPPQHDELERSRARDLWSELSTRSMKTSGRSSCSTSSKACPCPRLLRHFSVPFRRRTRGFMPRAVASRTS